ncbi:hypothetical protein HY58_14830 [Flavihumibacter sp. ZG627]|nr:hypothetical protein HY58_14830 [Flavihumibacter sp. ZG627]
MVSSNYYTNSFHSRNKQLLLNLLYRYSVPKTKIDIELACNNLLNEKYYSIFNNEAFYNIFSAFSLRPRQAVIIVKFSF